MINLLEKSGLIDFLNDKMLGADLVVVLGRDMLRCEGIDCKEEAEVAAIEVKMNKSEVFVMKLVIWNVNGGYWIDVCMYRCVCIYIGGRCSGGE